MAQIDKRDGEEHAVYYLSRKLLEYETRYTSVEKTCTSLVWVTKRLRHYMVSHPVKLVLRMDSIKYLFEKPTLTRRMARWLLLLSEFDITYVNKKLVKGRAISDHLAAFPAKADSQPTEDSFPDEDWHFMESSQKGEWQLYFDSTTNQKGFGAGLLLITPEDFYLPMAFCLEFSCTNNISKYEAYVIGLEMALSVGVERIKVFRNSSVVICQTQGKWRTKDKKLKPYQAYLEQLTQCFKEVSFEYLPRDNNQFVDALPTLASMVECDPRDRIQPFLIERRTSPAYGEPVNMLTEDGRPWYAPIIDYIKERRSYDGIQLLCVDEEQAQTIMKEIHLGICGPHMNARMLAKKILKMGYYWAIMEAECAAFVRRCHQCQIFTNIIHIPPTKLHSLNAPWPFSTWGIDVIGKITPKASNGHEFVLVAIDHFTKWVEAQSYAVLTTTKVAKFIKENIICRYGVP
ncbi:uncharacterized protein LOC122652990 [Telopea speciosissima]|uniref:uncharacterized protein LOC122652990 n=1 Tax=Telopea speciosissima TaxID=54955 RepID=UPI001CC71B39|nr:uncharacterized protein LOC122652990 [Telopea speciosissima]